MSKTTENPPTECVFQLADGRSVRCPAYPANCEYVRILDADGAEEAYWGFDERGKAPKDVVEAFMGALKTRGRW